MVVQHNGPYVEMAATESCEITVYDAANDIDAVVRNSAAISEQRCRATGTQIDSVRNPYSFEGFNENHHLIAGGGSHWPSVCLQRYLTSHSRAHSSSLAGFPVADCLELECAPTLRGKVWRQGETVPRSQVESQTV
jgi:hypothetical protein